MRPNQKIHITLKDESGNPIEIENMFLSIDFYLDGEYRYGFRSKPSDSKGIVIISYDDMEDSRLENLEVQPWDFKTKLEECDDVVSISFPSKNEMLRAADIRDTMLDKTANNISESWRKSLNQLLSAEDITLHLTMSTIRYDMMCCLN